MTGLPFVLASRVTLPPHFSIAAAALSSALPASIEDDASSAAKRTIAVTPRWRVIMGQHSFDFDCRTGLRQVHYIAPQLHKLKGCIMKKDIIRRISFAVLLGAFFVGLLPAPAGDLAPPPPKLIADAVKPFVDSHSLAGAVTLVANKDKVWSLEAIGYADVSGSRPMLIDAIFWIASMSKPITAAALMILVDDGKVKLDDPVEKYLPEFKDIRLAAEKGQDLNQLRKPAHPITVREAPTPPGGSPYKPKQENPTMAVLPPKDAVASYTKPPLLPDPGS